MKVIANQSLKSYNSFGVDVNAELFTEVKQEEDVYQILRENFSMIQILGGGSNLLLTKKQKGLIIKNSILGKKISRRFSKAQYVEVGSGENWHELVRWTLKKKLSGLENLSLIPGTVGAAPVQNIGAYGVELESVFHKLKAIDLKTGKSKIFFRRDCQFGYRDSVFKNKYKNRFIITRVWFKLSTEKRVDVKYGAIQDTLDKLKIKKPSPLDISNVIIKIRSSKLPDPAVLGNSGSFFKNPVITKSQFSKLQKKFKDIKYYPLPDGKVKIPAAWLIEQCGWKGKRIGDTGTYKKHALIIVNYGNATGKEILNCSKKIQASVFKKFGIKITPEIRINFE